jgi:putative tryptophan/tyrosine transport system substrate-binding protein
MKRREFIAGLGGATAWPLVVRAQQPAVPVIGYLSGLFDPGALVTAFRQGLGELGYLDGRNVEILPRSADGVYERLPELARDLVNRRVALIFASVPVSAVLAAKSATATTPIVFVNGVDPVELGLVASLNRPSGNITGVNFLVTLLTAKRLEVLDQLAPGATSIGFLVNPTNLATEAQIREAESAARNLGVRLVILHACTPGDIEAAFASLVGRQISALLGSADALLFSQRRQIAALAIRNAIPAIYEFREFVEAGGLMSYGSSSADAYRLAGTYAGRILKGEKPADLPVQQSTKIEFVINLKTAKALGLSIPPNLLALADEVIE